MADIPKKRGRGRPRKNPIIEPPAPPAEVVIMEGLGDDEPQTIELPKVEHVSLAPIPEDTHVEAPTPAEPEPPMLTYNTPSSYAIMPTLPDDKEEHRQLIDKIKKYRTGFDAARALPFNEDMSTDKLRSLLDDIRLTISSRNTSLLFRNGYLTMTKGVELVGAKAGVKCYGLADTLSKSAEVSDLLKEMEAEIGIKYISPWKRLAFLTISTAVVLHGLNQRAEVLAEYKAAPVNPNLDAKYKDL